MSESSAFNPSPNVWVDGRTMHDDVIRRFDTGPYPEGYWNASQVCWNRLRSLDLR